MRKNGKTKPTDAELEILKILWKHGPSTVKFINEIQNKKRTGRGRHIPNGNSKAHR